MVWAIYILKAATNRAPRKTTLGQPGEARSWTRLRITSVLADVGLLGFTQCR